MPSCLVLLESVTVRILAWSVCKVVHIYGAAIGHQLTVAGAAIVDRLAPLIVNVHHFFVSIQRCSY